MERDSPPRTSTPPGSESARPLAEPPPSAAAAPPHAGDSRPSSAGAPLPQPAAALSASPSGSTHPFAAEDLTAEAREAVDALCLDQRRRWLAGERPPVETYFARRPELAERPAELIELIYNEFLIREELVDRPDSQEFFARFPQCREALQRQFELHSALQDDGTWDIPSGGSGDSSSASRSSSLFPGFPTAASAERSRGAPVPPGGEAAGGRFEMLRRIGAGGMGVVYAAYDRLWRQSVALKTLHRQDPAALWRLKQEFRVLADQSHPNLVQLFELFVDEGRAYFTMEYVDGRDFVSWCTSAGRPSPAPHTSQTSQPTDSAAGDPTPSASADASYLAAFRSVPSDTVLSDNALSDRPQSNTPQSNTAPSAEAFPFSSQLTPAPPSAPFADGPFPEAAVREALRQLVDGLRAVHEADKLHCDLKPSNVLVSSAGRVVLLDFGMAHDLRQADPDRLAARREGAAAQREGTPSATASRGAADYLRGTIAYLAPERFRGGGPSRAADWYAVGVMLYQVLAGRTPFTGDAAEMVRAKLRGEPVHPREFGSRGSPELERLCLDWLARDPALRPTADEALARLTVAPAAAAQARREDLETLVGRGAALQVLHEAFQETVRGGRGRRLLVHGESGMGKTALVRRFAAEIESTAQGRVISGRCREHESIPFKAVDALLDHLAQTLVRLPEADVLDLLPPEAGALADLFPALQRVPAVEATRRMHPPPVDPVLRRTAAFNALGELLANLARSTPLVVCIDDVQWGDGDSARLLVYTLRAAEDAPVLWLACGRSEHLAESPFLCELRAALGEGVFPAWPLPPLEPADAAELARRHLAAPSLPVDSSEADRPAPADRLAPADRHSAADRHARTARHAELIARHSSGNPFLILELARGGEGAAEAAPAADAVLEAPSVSVLAGPAEGAAAASTRGFLSGEGPSSVSSSSGDSSSSSSGASLSSKGGSGEGGGGGSSGGSKLDSKALAAALRTAEDGRIDRVLWARIEQTTAAAQRLLEVVSTAGGPLRLATACRAAEVEDDPQKALMELRAGRLIRTWRRGEADLAEPYHDRIREGVERRLAPEAKRARHRGLAEAFEAEAAPDPRRLARHFHAALEPVKAARYAEAAGRAAFDAAAFDEAAQFFRLAVDQSPEDVSRRRTLTNALADALASAGRGAEAGGLYEALAADAPPQEAAELRRSAMEHLLRSGRFNEGIDAFRALILSQGLVWPESSGGLLWRFMALRLALAVRGLGFRLKAKSEVPIETRQRLDACWAAGYLLGNTDVPRCFYFFSLYSWHALRSGDGGRIARALAFESLLACAPRGRNLPRVWKLLEQATELAANCGDRRIVATVEMLRCGIWFYTGDWEQVERHTAATIRFLRERCTGSAFEIDWVCIYRLHGMFHLGRWKQLRAEAERCLEDARERGDVFLAAEMQSGTRNSTRLADDDVAGAERDLQAALRYRPRREYLFESFIDLIARVQIDLYQRDGAAAWGHMERAWPGLVAAHQFRVEMIHVEMLLLRARAALALLSEVGVRSVAARKPLAALAEDLRTLERSNNRWAPGVGRLHRASLVSLQGRPEEAARLLREAAEVSDRAGGALYASSARRRLGELLGGPEGEALVAAADAHFASEGVRRPDRMIHMLAPGFFAAARK